MISDLRGGYTDVTGMPQLWGHLLRRELILLRGF